MRLPETDYRALGRETRDGYGRWLMLIKALRAENHCSILDAERMALSNSHRRKWVERQINISQPCRKRALAHIRYNRERSLILRQGESFVFIIPPIPRSG